MYPWAKRSTKYLDKNPMDIPTMPIVIYDRIFPVTYIPLYYSDKSSRFTGRLAPRWHYKIKVNSMILSGLAGTLYDARINALRKLVTLEYAGAEVTLVAMRSG